MRLLKAIVNLVMLIREIIDKKVKNILRVMFKLKMIGDDASERKAGAYNTPEHRAAALKVAEDAKNNPNPEFFPPDFIVRDIKELGEMILASRE